MAIVASLLRIFPRRLHVQLATLFGLMFAASLTVYAIYTADEQGNYMIDLLRADSRALTAHIAAHAAETEWRDGAPDLGVVLRHVRQFPGLLSVAVVAADGRTLAFSRQGGAAGETPALLPPPAATGTALAAASDESPERLVSWAPIDAGARRGWVRVEMDTLPARQARSHILADSLIVAAWITLLATAAVWLFLRGPMAQIRRAAAFASELDRDFGKMLDAQAGPRETEELVTALNRASHRLAEQHEALIEGEMRKSAILEAAFDAIITFDRDGRILEFNAAAEAMSGYSRAEACDRHFARLLLPEEAQAHFVTALKRYVDRGHCELIGTRQQVTALRRDGRRFRAELAIAPVQPDERRLFTAYLRDIGVYTSVATEEDVPH